jgi:TPR repeat protein
MYLALVLLLVAGILLGWRWYFGVFPWQAHGGLPTRNSSTVAQTANPDSTPQQGTESQAASLSVPPSSGDAASPRNSPASGNSTVSSAPPQQASSQQMASPDAATASPSSTANEAQENIASSNKPAAADTAKASAEGPNQDQARNDEQAAAPAAAKKAAQLKENSPASKTTPRRVAMNEEDSSASEGEALLTQGERYLYGNGVAQNCGRAQDSIRAAADHASVQALTDLGTMYSTGHCVRKDLPTAYRWYVKALHQQPSNARISSDLQALWNQMSPTEKRAATQAR